MRMCTPYSIYIEISYRLRVDIQQKEISWPWYGGWTQSEGIYDCYTATSTFTIVISKWSRKVKVVGKGIWNVLNIF